MRAPVLVVLIGRGLFVQGCAGGVGPIIGGRGGIGPGVGADIELARDHIRHQPRAELPDQVDLTLGFFADQRDTRPQSSRQ